MQRIIDDLVSQGVRTVRRAPTEPMAPPAPETGSEPGGLPVVVLDARGEPYRLSTPEGVFPAVVVPPGTDLHNLAANARLVRTLTRTVPGVVVADAGRVIGFVSRADLVDALLFDGGLRGDTGSDPLLHGEPRAVSDAVRIRCLTCGIVNMYDYCLPGDRKDCANGHPLDADLE